MSDFNFLDNVYSSFFPKIEKSRKSSINRTTYTIGKKINDAIENDDTDITSAVNQIPYNQTMQNLQNHYGKSGNNNDFYYILQGKKIYTPEGIKTSYANSKQKFEMFFKFLSNNMQVGNIKLEENLSFDLVDEIKALFDDKNKILLILKLNILLYEIYKLRNKTVNVQIIKNEDEFKNINCSLDNAIQLYYEQIETKINNGFFREVLFNKSINSLFNSKLNYIKEKLFPLKDKIEELNHDDKIKFILDKIKHEKHDENTNEFQKIDFANQILKLLKIDNGNEIEIEKGYDSVIIDKDINKHLYIENKQGSNFYCGSSRINEIEFQFEENSSRCSRVNLNLNNNIFNDYLIDQLENIIKENTEIKIIEDDLFLKIGENKNIKLDINELNSENKIVFNKTEIDNHFNHTIEVGTNGTGESFTSIYYSNKHNRKVSLIDFGNAGFFLLNNNDSSELEYYFKLLEINIEKLQVAFENKKFIEKISLRNGDIKIKSFINEAGNDHLKIESETLISMFQIDGTKSKEEKVNIIKKINIDTYDIDIDSLNNDVKKFILAIIFYMRDIELSVEQLNFFMEIINENAKKLDDFYKLLNENLVNKKISLKTFIL